MVLLGRPCFLVGLFIGLAIDSIISIKDKVNISFSGYILWKMVTNLSKYLMVDTDSQIFSSSR